MKSYLLLLLLLAHITVQIELINKARFEQISNNMDYNHHVIFFDHQIQKQMQTQLQQWQHKSNVIFYLNDCKDNQLSECSSPSDNPLAILFNRVSLRFNANADRLDNIEEWMASRINKNPTVVTSLTQIQNIITNTPNVQCFVANEKKRDEQSVFYALAKNYPFLNYCLITNSTLAEELGLQQGNLTYFIDSTTNRREFIYPNRYQAWQWFIKANLLSSIQRASPLAGQRFTQSPKNISFYAIACDFSMRCERIWSNIIKLEPKLTGQILGHDFRLAIQDQKESFTFNLYFHLTFDSHKLPALIHIDLRSDSERAGDLVRHIEYIDGDFSEQVLKSFIDRTTRGQIQPFYQSAALPKKNGFYGKSSERFIQKLVASNALQTISASPNNYVILVTAMNIGCNECETFYKEYKQVASLLLNKDITFGLLDANLNEVPLQHVKQLPDLLLYRKQDKANPARMTSRHNFDNLIQFVKDNLGSDYSNTDEL